MSLFASPPNLHRAGWRVWAMSIALIYLGPMALGLGVLALAYVAGLALPEGSGLLASLYIGGFILFFSPILSWVGLLVALPLAAVLMARGVAGWGSFAVLGLIVGGVAGAALGDGYLFIAPLFGVLAAVTFRAIFFAFAQ